MIQLVSPQILARFRITVNPKKSITKSRRRLLVCDGVFVRGVGYVVPPQGLLFRTSTSPSIPDETMTSEGKMKESYTYWHYTDNPSM